jgi:hypothetical protein
MKGFISKSVAAAGLTGGLSLLGGCDCYRNIVDPCYPSRYEMMSRQEAVGSMAPQVNNGHVLDQTVWNYHFETGTDKLTPGGIDHLAYIARRRPYPDPTVYLQTARDITYNQAESDKYVESRRSLDKRRIQAIQNYLNAQTAGRNLTFDVVAIDPSEPGMSAIPANISIQKLNISSQGNLPVSTGSVSGGAGAAGAGGAGAGAGAGAPPTGGGGH